jgi:AraC-like DNA-binding protein
MKPFLEKINKPVDASWSMLNRRLQHGIPFQWHHHPELELTLTLNSRGLRFIGDQVGQYDDGDLVLLGPNLPHTWASREAVRAGEPHVALVLWFDEDWAQRLTSGFVEFAKVEQLLARARRGVQFSRHVSNAVREDYSRIFEQPPLERLLGLMKLLNQLAGDRGARPLASDVFRPSPHADSRERIDRVLAHIHEHYTQELSLQELADVAALSVSGLHRMFRKHARTNVSEYITRIRIGDACARLASTEQPIAHIADAVGYGTFANFNRQFKQLTTLTPRAYRANFRASSGT